MKNDVRKMTYTALFTAIICVLTIIVKIPSVNGYLNLGDCGVYTAAVIGGPFIGAFAGGVGSAAADLISGYAMWVLPTFIIKGVMGGVVGYAAKRYSFGKLVSVKNLLAMMLTGMWMVVGYYFADVLVFGETASGFIAALWAMVPNVVQTTVGILAANILLSALSKTKINLI